MVCTLHVDCLCRTGSGCRGTLHWLHRCRALGVYHRFRLKHLQSYLDEFAFLFNRRKTRNAAFRSLLGIAVVTQSTTYNMLIKPEATR